MAETGDLQAAQDAANREAQEMGAAGACGFETDEGVAFYAYGEADQAAGDDADGS